MTRFYNIKHIKLGASTRTGHIGYPDAKHRAADGKISKIIVKENKHGDPQFSRLEVAFSQVAALFLANQSTPFEKIVVDDNNEVLGLAVQHLCYVIEKKEGLQKAFYKLNKNKLSSSYRKRNISDAEDIPIYFLDKLPHEFFAHLLEEEKKKNLTIDYASLASIFVSSYTLEEDDLHKGNFGFYMIEEEGKPRVVFFKIDHDLMFVDSIMSFFSVRFFHWLQAEKAFDITEKDLHVFPNLSDSSNSYWPTKKSHIPNLLEDKEFRTDLEVASFSSLSKVPEFNKAKWFYFYKHILLPAELIRKSLYECLDDKNPEDRAQVALLTEAIAARQARLRAVLFSMSEFKDFVRFMSEADKKRLLEEVVYTDPEQKETVSAKMDEYANLCQSGFDIDDTPLHVAIRLGDYRYDETIQMFGEYIHYRNSQDQYPLDIALQMAQDPNRDIHPRDVRQDARFTMKNLLKHGANKTEQFKQFDVIENIENYRFNTPYLNKSSQARGYSELKTILRDIGEDINFCLKFKKNLAIECIGRFIQSNHANPNLRSILVKLRNDMDGNCSEAEAAPLKFIRQLRSKLWIIRQIRGLYGTTTTQDEIHSIINQELERIKANEPNNFSFFSSNEPAQPVEAQISLGPTSVT